MASLISVAAFAVPMGAYLAWRLVTFGDYLPNTARAKEQGRPALSDLSKPAAFIGYAGWLTVVIAVSVVAVAVARPSPTRTVVAMLLLTLGLAVADYAILRPDWMAQQRFATAIWPMSALIVTLLVVEVLRGTSTRLRLVTTTLATIAAVLTAWGFWLSANDFRK